MADFTRIEIKNLALLKKTILHPQWLIYREEVTRINKIVSACTGKTLDIGCADQQIRSLLKPDCEYIGLDYLQTVSNLYGTLPMIFGDAQKLPVLDDSMDTVILTEVLEHVPDPVATLNEIFRVLKPSGKLVMSMPFLYPIHDAPYDFQRLTLFGLHELAKRTKFTIDEELAIGHPIATACLLGNISLSKTGLSYINNKHPAAIFCILLPLIIPFLNVIASIFEKFSPEDNFMPHGYMLVMKK